MIFSLIIPVYNVAQYLQRCLDSVLCQALVDFEVILIDDKSTDCSGKICEQYATLDSRIIVCHQPVNQGVSAARNTGIAKASGEWVIFIDSDDSIQPDYLERLYSVSSKADFVLSGDRYIENGKLIREDIFPEWFWNVSSNCTEVDIKYIENITSLHGKLFRRDILLKNNIRFDNTLRFGEDRDFCIRYLSHVSSVYYLPYAGYCYNTDIAGSLSKQKVQNLLLTDINYWNRIHAIIGDSCPQYQVNRLYNFLVDNIMSGYKTCGLREVYIQMKRVKSLINSEFLHRYSKNIIAPQWMRFIVLKLF